MNGLIQRLRAEIASDRQAFEERVDEVGSLDLGANTTRATLSQAAVALHHAYGAAEGIMTRCARYFEGDIPTGSDWHQTLLRTMALELKGVRPAVLGADTVAALRPVLAFRHFFRHAYAVELDPQQLTSLTGHALRARALLGADLDRLDAFLADLAKSSHEG